MARNKVRYNDGESLQAKTNALFDYLHGRDQNRSQAMEEATAAVLENLRNHTARNEPLTDLTLRYLSNATPPNTIERAMESRIRQYATRNPNTFIQAICTAVEQDHLSAHQVVSLFNRLALAREQPFAQVRDMFVQEALRQEEMERREAEQEQMMNLQDWSDRQAARLRLLAGSDAQTYNPQQQAVPEPPAEPELKAAKTVCSLAIDARAPRRRVLKKPSKPKEGKKEVKDDHIHRPE